MIKAKEVNHLMSNREEFDSFVYTPISRVLEELKKRKRFDKKIDKYLKETLHAGIPDQMTKEHFAVVFVQVATPNVEIRKFIEMVSSLNGFRPMFFEYLQDKFTDNNEWKYHLGKLSFLEGMGKNGDDIIKKLNVLDFNQYKGKKIVEAQTLWGQSLADFHHELFAEAYPSKTLEKIVFYDASDWFDKSGHEPHKYYEAFFKLFLKDHILFENYMLNDKEKEFTAEHILPALLKIKEEVGLSPLIVNIQPTSVEGLPFWMYHPHSSFDFVHSKLDNKAV